MAKVLVLQHHPVENLGLIADSLETAALAWQYVRSYAGQAIPIDMKGAGGLIVMGGPMGVYEQDRYPFLRDEIRLIENALKQGKPVLGVCLGAQLLAATLGAKVSKNSAGREIGWYPVGLSPNAREDRLFRDAPASFTPLHWHGDVFDLPAGAVALASSEKTTLQAFRHGDNAYGLLFHIEANAETVAGMVHEFADELTSAGIDGREIVARGDRHLTALATLAETVFGRWAASIQGT